MTISEKLKAEVLNQGLSRYRVAKMTRLATSMVTRFMNGDRGLTLAAADRVAEALQLRLTEVKNG